jgi:hypothetical protein
MVDIVFSLILGPDPESIRDRDLRGEFCHKQNSNPLKYYIHIDFYE